jgi:hypothetical protein
MARAIVTVAACATLLWATAVQAGLTAGAKCAATKNQEAGKYALCLQKAEAKLVKTKGACSTTSTTVCYRDEGCPSGETCNKDLTKYTEATGKCLSQLTDKWGKAEAKAGGPCPDDPLTVGNFEEVIEAHSQNIATALDGGALAKAGSRLKTGQTQCDDGTGTLGSCPGTPAGQDGELQKGLARSYTDNTDGTITDKQTGLMWEKLSDDGTIHDWNDTYTWYTAFTSKIATLNSGGGFAGYTDWRLPNVNELQSLADYGRASPAIDPVFDAGCAPSCTVTSCSCMQGSYYWSSTSREANGDSAWYVNFSDGIANNRGKGLTGYVRAVRGGP